MQTRLSVERAVGRRTPWVLAPIGWRAWRRPPHPSVIPPLMALCPLGWTYLALGSADPAHPGPSRLPHPHPPSPLHPSPFSRIFQVIIIQPQVQTQPESTAEARPPTEEPSQGAQATKKKKEDQPPSQENPEVGRLWSGGPCRTWRCSGGRDGPPWGTATLCSGGSR